MRLRTKDAAARAQEVAIATSRAAGLMAGTPPMQTHGTIGGPVTTGLTGQDLIGPEMTVPGEETNGVGNKVIG